MGASNRTPSFRSARERSGQTKNISGPYVLSTTTTNYTRTIDLTQPASRVTGTSRTPAPAGAPPAQPVNLNQSIAPNAPWTQQLEIWITPWGFLRGAAANNATVRQERIAGKTFDVVSWMTPQKSPSGAVYTVTGYIDDKKMVDRVETWVEHRSSATSTSRRRQRLQGLRRIEGSREDRAKRAGGRR
jgi:hypothetical protein